MNTLIIFLATAIIFTFGYLFYAKFLSYGLFPRNENYPATESDKGATECDEEQAPDAACGEEYKDRSRHHADAQVATPSTAETSRYSTAMSMSEHIAMQALPLTLATAATALMWGWVPAYLWIMIATALIGGMIGIGGLWLASRHPGERLWHIAAHYGPPHLGAVTRALILIVLVSLAATLLSLLAGLLVQRPAISTTLWALLAIFMLGSGRIFSQFRLSPLVSLGIALIVCLIGLWLLSALPIGFSGALNLDAYGVSMLSVDAAFIWIALLTITLVRCDRRFMPATNNLLLGSFALALLVLIIALPLIANLLNMPSLAIPQSHTSPGMPATVPWFPLVLTGGAWAGLPLLIASTYTATRLRPEPSVLRRVGYGGAIIEALIALSALIVIGVGLESIESWRAIYADWGTARNPGYMLDLYINGIIFFAGTLGINTDLAANLTALALAAALFATLGAILHIKTALTADLTLRRHAAIGRWLRPALYTLVALLSLAEYRQENAGLWLIFGAANALLACLGLLLLGRAVAALGRNPFFALVPLALLLPLSLWGIGAEVLLWWNEGAWTMLPFSLALLYAGMIIALESLRLGRDMIHPAARGT